PIAIVTGEASFHGPYEHCVVKFLQQAGVHPTWLNLGAMGIHGNGHMMMLEKNSDQIADRIEKWARKALSEKTAGTPQRRASGYGPLAGREGDVGLGIAPAWSRELWQTLGRNARRSHRAVRPRSQNRRTAPGRGPLQVVLPNPRLAKSFAGLAAPGWV